MKPIILKKWTEVDQTMLTDDKHAGRVEHCLFIANCEEHKGPKSGKITNHRRKTVKSFIGDSRKEADRKVAEFCAQEGVVVLDHDTQ